MDQWCRLLRLKNRKSKSLREKARVSCFTSVEYQRTKRNRKGWKRPEKSEYKKCFLKLLSMWVYPAVGQGKLRKAGQLGHGHLIATSVGELLAVIYGVEATDTAKHRTAPQQVSLRSPGWPRTHYIAKASLELVPQSSKGWDYRHGSPYPAWYRVIESRPGWSRTCDLPASAE